MKRFLLLFVLFTTLLLSFAADNRDTKNAQRLTASEPHNTWLNVNNISTQFQNIGLGDHNESLSGPGFVFPKGSGKTVVYESGLLWGVRIGDSIHVGGSTYNSGLQPGKILAPGIAEDRNLPKNRIYRVRPDYAAADLSSEVADEGRPVSEIRNQYATDWNEWPARDGAPFDDRNGNGTYEPGIDIPGKKGADQTVWYVCNDLDTARTINLYGRIPVGMEMQVTIWAYARKGPLGNMLFKNYRLINKSTNTFDTLYVAQWVDIEVGDCCNDFGGSDTTLSLQFGYNGLPSDQMYADRVPPAVGYQFLTLPMYAAVTKWTGSPISDPVLGRYESGGQWYNWMRGLLPDGRLFADWRYPNAPTRFWLDGDPVTGVGRVDGDVTRSPGSRRMHATVGPFKLLPNQSLDVPVAAMAGFGTNNIKGVKTLRKYAHAARSNFNGILNSIPPDVTVAVSYPSSSQAALRLVVDVRQQRMQSVTATLMWQSGLSAAVVSLFDDGLHGDGAANDGVWGNTAMVSREATAYVNVATTDSAGRVLSWERMSDDLPVAGEVRLTNAQVFSDNLNNNGVVNSGENIRFGFSLSNQTAFALNDVDISPEFGEGFKSIHRVSIAAGATFSLTYNPNDSLSYFSFNAPTNGVAWIPFTIVDGLDNIWRDTVRFDVVPLPAPVQQAVVQHVAGIASGTLDVLIVDPAALRNHRYAIQGVDSIDTNRTRGLTLRDSTDGRVLLMNHTFPDPLGHNIPLTDGFKIVRGSIELAAGFKDWQVPNSPPGARRWSWADAYLGLEGFEGAIGWDSPAHYHGYQQTKSVPGESLHTTLIKLATAASGVAGNGANPYAGWSRATTTDPNMSYAYRYLRGATVAPARPEFAPFIINRTSGYAYQDYLKGVPFSAWNVDVDPPQRLAVGFLENNISSGLVDGCWWSPANGSGQDNASSNGPREWFFVFDRPYTDATPDPSLRQDILTQPLPVMWMGAVTRRGGNNFSQPPLRSGDDQFLIVARHPPTSRDIWTFNPLVVNGDGLPTAFALSQNFPNPFNAGTTIQFHVPISSTANGENLSHISLKVYDLLGREVVALVHEVKTPGRHQVQWSGRSNAGNVVATGVYFYRIEVNGVGSNKDAFTQVKKMLLLR